MSRCIFLLADKNMQGAFEGFLNRELDHNIGVRRFEYKIIVDVGKDPGVYKRAHQLLRLYQRDYEYAVIVLDEAWSGSPKAAAIREHISDNMIRSGWDPDKFEVIVIVPELEAWILQDSTHVADAFRFSSPISIRQWLQERDLWEEGAPKCADPKQAIEALGGISGVVRSSAIYKRITQVVSFRRCTDPAFHTFCETVRRWFPAQ